ncbi:MAG TPA: hypothetical protein VER12_03565 [Polyangiaceae bacterium]|nr:hypothetical protein [Polyangiaceae bacterium]HYQ28456.1 hypothetical protein [Polyangiaceae bacterium]
MRIARFALLFLPWLAVACAGAEPSPNTQPKVAEAPAPAASALAASAAGEPEPSSEPAKPEPSAGAASSDAAAPAPAKSEPDPNATREVTYVVVPEGLKISVAGVRFAVSASAVQVASGWGVKLNVVASVLDGKAHSLSSPKSGPLAFAGSVSRNGKSEAETFGDERSGDGEQEISAETPAKFSRTWPAKGVRVLGTGDSLDLQVALWGLGSDKDSRRPVKKFCHVRMKVEKGKPRAIVEPPQGISSK